jgi:hypothetical protein
VAAESPAVELAGDVPPRSGPRAELVLLALTVISLALLPVHIKTAYSGLPAHPLLLHVPVILIPVATVWSLVLVFRPNWITRQGVLVASVAVVALAGTILAMGSGSALRATLHLERGERGPRGTNSRANLVAQHSHAANTLRLAMIAFTLVLIATVLAHRVADGRPSGREALDHLLAQAGTRGVRLLCLPYRRFGRQGGMERTPPRWSRRAAGPQLPRPARVRRSRPHPTGPLTVPAREAGR